MALVAAAATALAAWCAAAALGGAAIGAVTVPAALLALLLLPGVALTPRRTAAATAGRGPGGGLRVLPEGGDAVFFAAIVTGGLGALYLVGWTNGAHVGQVARLMPLVVVALSPWWPHPTVLRFSLLLVTGSLIGVAVTPAAAPWAVVATVAAAALGVVATNRLVSATGPRLGPPPPPDGRRLALEAGSLAALVAVIAAAAAALVPPPPGPGGTSPQAGARTSPQAGARPGARRNASAAPVVDFQQQLDVGAGRGKRSDQVVLRVAAGGPDLWRATTYDHWDGESWARSPDTAATVAGARSDPGADSRTTPVPPGIGDPTGPADPTSGPAGHPGDFVQRITVEAQGADVVVAAARPVGVTLPYGTAQVGDDASLRPSAPLVRGRTYVVTSARSAPGAGALRSLGDIAAAVPLEVADRYLQLPQVAPDVRALAARLGASTTAPSTYDTVRAVNDWLDGNIRATDTATTVAPGADPIEQILLVDRAGSPERISAALAVMLRTLGIPARLAVGFLPGRRAGVGGDFEVRASDAHAWVEAWFPGAGWQRFDPTGKAPAPGARDDSIRARLGRLLAALRPLLLLVTLAMTTYGAWLAYRWRRRRAALPWATRFLSHLERAGRARGRPRRPEETPKEYAAGLAAGVLADPRLEEVGDLVTVAAYSSRDPNREAKDRAEEVLRQAVRAAPVRRLRRRSRSSPPDGPRIPEP